MDLDSRWPARPTRREKAKKAGTYKRGGKKRKWKRRPACAKDKCPICLCRIRTMGTSAKGVNCNHYYHVTCYGELIKTTDNCSICRRSFD